MSVETNAGRVDGTGADGRDDGGLSERWRAVKRRVADAARRSGRRPEEILLVAVTKGATLPQIRRIVELGQRDLAENRVQQLLERVDWMRSQGSIRDPDRAPDPEDAALVRWHMIGTLQRNKIRKAVEHARLVQSVDNLRLAEDLHTEGGRRDRPIEVLVQVNVSGEASKQGLNPRALGPFLEQVVTMVNLEVRGLMCMAPYTKDPEEVRPVFERCRELFEEQRPISAMGGGGDRFNILSMGMSNDFEVAIECGANLVRVGSAIFDDDFTRDGGADGRTSDEADDR